MTTPKLDLAPFCSTDETRPRFHRPWNYQDWCYATDGGIIVRVDLLPEFDGALPNKTILALTLKMFADFPSGAEFVPLPEMGEIPEIIECVRCGGTGNSPTIHEYGCGRCDGEGKYNNMARIQIGPRDIAAHYVAKLQHLPSLLVAINFGSHETPLPFLFNGGCGLLMPMRKNI